MSVQLKDGQRLHFSSHPCVHSVPPLNLSARSMSIYASHSQAPLAMQEKLSHHFLHWLLSLYLLIRIPALSFNSGSLFPLQTRSFHIIRNRESEFSERTL